MRGSWWDRARERLPGTPDSASHLPTQAQTRAALLRALQEDEEHWGSPEDLPSTLAQDVCEVGAGKGVENQLDGAWWENGISPPPHPSSPSHSPTLQLLEEHTERAPRISQEFGERMAHCCLGGLAEFLQRYGGLGTGRRLGGVSESKMQQREGRDEREEQGRMGRGASLGITGFAGLSACKRP